MESFVFLGRMRLLLNWPITASIRLQCELGAWRKPCDSTSNRLSKKARNNAFDMLLEGHSAHPLTGCAKPPWTSPNKLKMALDEGRLMILGAQVVRVPVSNGFSGAV